MDSIQEREFEQFVTGSGRRLLRTAVLLVGDLGHAEDLVQVALERTARHWSRLDGAPERTRGLCWHGWQQTDGGARTDESAEVFIELPGTADPRT